MRLPVLTYVVILNSIICYFGAAVYVSSGSTPYFRKDYTFNAETQTFYKFHSIRKNWPDAAERCELEGAKLFMPETQLERDIVIKDFVEKNIPTNSDPWIWLGMHDQFSEGDFVTTDGRSIDEVFVDWWHEDPNNYLDNEDCGVMKLTGKMYDIECEKTNAVYICQKPRTTLEWNHLCNLPDMSYKYNKELGKCHKLHLTPKIWQDANAACTAEQSYLAIINSQAEFDYYKNIINAAPKNGIRAGDSVSSHLGFHNLFLKGWTTIKGQRLEDTGYTTWSKGQPDNAGDERCGTMHFQEGIREGLNDLKCSLTAIFICEHDIDYLASDFHERFNNLNNTSAL